MTSHVALTLSVDSELVGRVRLGAFVLAGVTVRATDDVLTAEIEAYGTRVREQYRDLKSGDVPGAADARELYKALGLDPTKTRPSNEALLRRVLKGESLYRINTLVDALNFCALRHQIPYGLYDQERIEPPVVFRRGLAGESYEGIRKAAVNAEGRPVLADARGPFGNPTSDSARTCITLDTHRAWVIAYAPAPYPVARLEAVLDDTAATLTRFCGGTFLERSVV